MIYFDNASTACCKSEVLRAMMPYFTERWYNPSSLYRKADSVRQDVEFARKFIGKFINADKREIFFTSGGSESNCWAIQGFVNNYKDNPCIITSNIEHKSIMECVKNIDADIDVSYVSVDSKGFVNISELENVLCRVTEEKENVMVSIQFANNEIGTIQHIKEIADIVHKYNTVFHTDAVQAFGQIPIDVKKLDIDLLSASGHKIGTPKGVGILYKKKGIEIKPLIYGSQMDGMRGGTENVPYIMGMAKAVDLCQKEFELKDSVTNNRDYMIEQLKQKFGCKINGDLNFRIPNNISATFPQNLTGESLVYLLDMCGVCISAGAACNSRSIQPSYVLKAVGLTDEDALKTIRMSLPNDVDVHIINNVICELEKIIKIIEQ